MDPKSSQVKHVDQWLCVLAISVAVGCAPSRPIVTNPESPPPAPVPVAIAISPEVPEAAAAPVPAQVSSPSNPAPTLETVRALRRNGQLADYESALQTLSASTDTTTRHSALALQGLFLFDEKRWPEAVAPLAGAAAELPVVAPFLTLRIMEAEASQGKFPEAINAAERILAMAPNTSAAKIATLRLPALHSQAGDIQNANRTFERLATVPIDELSERDFLDVATVMAQAGRNDLAGRLRMRLLSTYPQGRFTEDVYDKLVAQADSPLVALALDDSVNLAGALARVNRYDQALDLLQRTSARFPKAGTSDLYRRTRLRALFNSRKYEQLLQETASGTLDDASLELLRARAAWRADRPQEFLAGLDRVEKRFPRTPQATEAKVQRAKYYVTDQVDYARSIANLTEAIDAGYLGNDSEHLWTLGWTYTLWQKDQEALRVFDRYLASNPDGDYRTNSLFWSAKIHERNGRLPERDAKLRQVTIEYPYNYYAYRAREILGVPTVAPSEIAGGAVFPNIEEQLSRVTGTRIEAVRQLMQIDLLRDATREMKMLAAEHPDNAGVAFMLADVYVANGEPFKANGILQRNFRKFVRHGGSGVPARFWQILYPLNYWDAIRAEAERRELDPYLLASIIRQESGFEPTTVSNAGAVGLMQIMPEEAPRIASAAGLEGITRERLFDPEQNIAVGAAEYSQKLALMSGNHTHAIAAYNAGEGPVGNWIAATAGGDQDMFIESISYAETRLYVKTVTRNRFEYRRIYEIPGR